jgi:hypothetical protein
MGEEREEMLKGWRWRVSWQYVCIIQSHHGFNEKYELVRDPKYGNEYTEENLIKLFTSGRRFEHELLPCFTSYTHESNYVFCYVKRPENKI